MPHVTEGKLNYTVLQSCSSNMEIIKPHFHSRLHWKFWNREAKNCLAMNLIEWNSSIVRKLITIITLLAVKFCFAIKTTHTLGSNEEAQTTKGPHGNYRLDYLEITHKYLTFSILKKSKLKLPCFIFILMVENDEVPYNKFNNKNLSHSHSFVSCLVSCLWNKWRNFDTQEITLSHLAEFFLAT